MSSLHEAIVAFEMRKDQQLKTASTSQSATSSSSGNQRPFVGTFSETGAGCHHKSLSIVPVKVRGKGEANEVITYALLDNGSTASFLLRSFDEAWCWNKEVSDFFGNYQQCYGEL